MSSISAGTKSSFNGAKEDHPMHQIVAHSSMLQESVQVIFQREPESISTGNKASLSLNDSRETGSSFWS